MVKRNKTPEIKSNNKRQAKTKPSVAVGPNSDFLDANQPSGDFSQLDISDSVNNQVAQLSDIRLPATQRQALASQIGHKQGNRHLGRVTSEAIETDNPQLSRERSILPLASNQTPTIIQMLRNGRVDSVQYNEDPRDVIAISMPYQIGDFDTILSNINLVVQQFGSSSRTYTNDVNFQLMFRSFLQEIGHPSISGGGPVMTRQRTLRLRIRLNRGEGRRINSLQLLRPLTEVEVTTPERVETRPQPEPSPTREPIRETEEQAPTEDQSVSPEYRATASEVASGAESIGDIVSSRWMWDPITRQMAEWEAELDRIGEQGSPTTPGSILIVPVSLLFVILNSIVGLLDLLARLNPLNLVLRGYATSVRASAGLYTREDFLRDAEAVGQEAFDIITLGLRNAYAHLREGIEEVNAFRITQAIGEIALAALAIFGIFRAIRIRSSAGRMAAAVAEERAAPATPLEPTPPGEAVRPTATTESAIEAGAEQPGRRPGSTPGRPQLDRVFNTEEAARRVRDSYMSGEAQGGWDAAFSQESLQAHWEGIGGRGRPPMAFIDTNGHLVFDANRVGMPHTGVVAEGTARRIAQRPTPPSRIQEPVRGTAATEQAAVSESVRPTAPTEQAATAEPVRSTAPTEQAATAEPIRPTAPTEQAATAEPVRPTAPTEQAATAEPVRPTAPTEQAATAESVRSTAPTEQAVAEPARPTTTTEPTAAQGRPQLERVFNTEEAARRIRDQYASGEAQGGWDAAFSQESLQAHWEGIGGEGAPPLAFMDSNGHLVFDARRVGMPPERTVAEGTARRVARRPPAPPPQIYEAIREVERARLAKQDWQQNGDPVIRHWTTDAMQNAWERAGGEGTAPVAFVKDNGVLVVNMEALRGQ